MISDVTTWRGVALAALVLVAGRVEAQDKGGDGFLFKPPSGAFTIRGGFDRASAGSDVFTFVTDRLTVGRGDFSSPTLVVDVDYRVTPRIGALFGVGFSQSNRASEYRKWVDNNRRPIEQTTTYARVPLTASIKTYLADPGRAIGHFAWIPARYAPYVGAGGGVMWYRFQQQGDFIDEQTLHVFPDRFDSDGWTPTVQAFAGTDVSLNPRFAVTMEGRYQWGRARMSTDFARFDRIDLSGLTLTAGISIRY